MTTQLDGQTDLLDLLPTAANPPRKYCRSCGANWGLKLKPEVLARKGVEHADVKPGVCQHMVALQELYAGLLRGEGWAYVVWTDETRAAHLAAVHDNLAQTWAIRDAAVEAGRRWFPDPQGNPCSDCGKKKFTVYAGGYRDTTTGRDYHELCEDCSQEAIWRGNRGNHAVALSAPKTQPKEGVPHVPQNS